MAVVRAFRGIRPAADMAEHIAALPYDVYNRKEAAAEVAKEPLSFLRIDRAEVQFDESVGAYEDVVYKQAHDTFWGMVEEKQFINESSPCYYIYELTMNQRTQTGIAACASIDDYLKNKIKKHENTRSEKELDRINHVDRLNAQTGPIFLAYRSNETINHVILEKKKELPLYDFTTCDQVRHTVWRIAEAENVKLLLNAFAAIDSIYIADGHHRAASAVKVGLKRREEHPGYSGEEAFNFFLSVLFPHDQLMILAYNRVVKDLNGYSDSEFLKLVSERFILEPKTAPFTPDKKGTFGMYLRDTWYKLTVKTEYISEDPVGELDVSVLQNELLDPVLGIYNPKEDDRIDFVGGIRGTAELEKRVNEDCIVAFSMYPTSIEELFCVADVGLLMPPKSTWFEPKLRSGLFIHSLKGGQ